MTTLIFIIALSILIFVHEWGHFYIAKKSGVRVDVFSIGFGPKLFGFKWNGTEYRISPFPFGGYVKIYGQEPLEEAEGDIIQAEKIAKDPDSFASKPVWKKLSVVFAGPIMNVVLCLVVLPLVFMVGRLQPKIYAEPPVVVAVTNGSPAESVGLEKGDLIRSIRGKEVLKWKSLMTEIMIHPDEKVELVFERDGKEKTVYPHLVQSEATKQAAGYLGIEPYEFYGNDPIINTVQNNFPAGKAGFQNGDRILEVNNQPIQYWSEMTKIVRASKDKPINFVVQRGEGKKSLEKVSLTVIPEYSDQTDSWVIGVTKKVDEEGLVKDKHGFTESIVLGTQEFKKLVTMTGDILLRLFTGQLSFKALGGPLQIAQVASSAAKSGFGDFLYILAFLSLQLGILNLLPIPILDGGHIVFMSIEAIMRKPLPHKFRMVSMQIGLVMLLTLMLFVTINDVDNIWGFSNIFEKIKGIF